METTDTRTTTARSSHAARPNLNKAAGQVAAAFGLKVVYGRENLEPTSERLAYRWSVEDSSGVRWDMDLVCLPVLWGQEGWAGSLLISRYGVPDLIDQSFVSYGDRLYGRKACKLTRERFCAWAATLEPGSRGAENAIAVKPEPMEVA